MTSTAETKRVFKSQTAPKWRWTNVQCNVCFSWSGVYIYIYIYFFKYPVRWQKLLGNARSGSTALSCRNCVITPGWRLMRIGYRMCFRTLYDEKKGYTDIFWMEYGKVKILKNVSYDVSNIHLVSWTTFVFEVKNWAENLVHYQSIYGT